MLDRLSNLARTIVSRESASVQTFRNEMIQTLKNPPVGGIDVAGIRARSGISEEGAARVLAELYLRFARKVAADGVITDAERAKLDRLAAVLGLDSRKARSIEQIAGSEVYEQAAQDAMADGVVTLEEAAHLAEMRRNLLPDPDDVDEEADTELASMFDRNAFQEALVRDFKGTDARTFDLMSYADRAGVPLSIASEIGEFLYAKFAAKVCADGIITATEREHLNVLARAFHVSPTWASQVERKAKRDVYCKAVVEALADGVISPSESGRLTSMRQTLDLPAGDASREASGLAAEAYEAIVRRIVESGVADQGVLQELSRFKRGLGLSNADANAMIRGRALDLYRETFAEIIQDGDITREQEHVLEWLQAETGIGADQVAPFAEQLAEVKRLAGYRSGRLPLVDTRKLLEGGETCHWDSPCSLLYQTARGVQRVDGELVATSKRVIFISPTRNYSFAPWKIVDLEERGRCVTVKTESRQGSGDYYVGKPRELEAILTGLARRGKYTATQGTGAGRTRHIPGDVKRAVWARDGGRCVQCQDNRYLEYDHIIPHSLGGANTYNNVQLLCRQCNSDKGDRI